jgi:hypothetical protein
LVHEPPNADGVLLVVVHALQEGYAKRGAQQSGAIKDAQAKVMALENSLAQVGLGKV